MGLNQQKTKILESGWRLIRAKRDEQDLSVPAFLSQNNNNNHQI